MRNVKKILLSTLMASLSGSMIFAAGNVTQYDNVLSGKNTGLSKSQIIIYADDDDTIVIKPVESGKGDNRPVVKPVKPEVKPAKPEVKPVKPEVKPVKPEVKPVKPADKPSKTDCTTQVKKEKKTRKHHKKVYKHETNGVWPSKPAGTTKPVVPPKVGNSGKTDNRPVVVPVVVPAKPAKPVAVETKPAKGNNGIGNKYGHKKNKKNKFEDEYLSGGYLFETRGK